jgi:hypothetical protein
MMTPWPGNQIGPKGIFSEWLRSKTCLLGEVTWRVAGAVVIKLRSLRRWIVMKFSVQLPEIVKTV